MTERLNGQSLPDGWVWTTFGAITQTVTKGASPNWQGFEYEPEGIVFVRSQNVAWGQLDLDSTVYVSEKFNQKQSKSIIEVDDVLLNIVGASIGRAAKATKAIAGGNLNQAVAIIRLSKPYIDVDYAVFYLVSVNAQEQISSRKVDVARANLSLADIKQMVFPLAPLNEQRRIVAAIETQFTRLDAAVTALKRSQANLKRYRAAVLKAACEGRLVPTEAALAQAEGCAYEPAAVLLERILAERRCKWEAENPKKQYQQPVAPDTSALPGLPEGWCWATLDELTFYVTSGSRGWADYYSSDGAIFIRAQDINTDELVLDNVARVDLPDSVEGTRTQVRKNDLLITITGANVTKTALVKIDIDNAFVNQHIGLARPVDAKCSSYMYFWIISPLHGRKQLETFAYGAGKPGLNLTNIREVTVAFPPFAEQQRIITEVERRLSLIDQLEKTIETDLARANRLRQSILKQAFAGKLVPQDPNDEPAAVLLERLRT